MLEMHLKTDKTMGHYYAFMFISVSTEILWVENF